MMMDLVQVPAQVCDEDITTNKTVNSGNKKRVKIEGEGSTSISQGAAWRQSRKPDIFPITITSCRSGQKVSLTQTSST